MNPTETGSCGRLAIPLAAILALVGATAVTAQVVLLRELLVAFGGNEMAIGVALASWLLWTAVGSGVLSRLARRADPRRTMAGLQLVAAALLPGTVLAIRSSRAVFQALPGELLGPLPLLLTSLLALSAFCAVSGWLFAAGTRVLAQATAMAGAQSIGSMYLLEATGSAAGGVLASLALLPFLNSFQVALLIGVANLGAAVFLASAKQRMRLAAYTLLILLVPGLLLIGARLDHLTVAAQWPGFRVLALAQSRYGSLAVLENETGRTLVENGLPVASVPDPQSAEESVHFALLQHAAPRSLLLIGGGVNGSLSEALRHPTMERVDYVELDPKILRLARRYFSPQWAASDDPRVHVHSADGRLFLKTTGERFDVIILALPDPQSAQLNRFYTLEFFKEAADRLAPGGVLSFQVQASENYISPAQAELLRSLRATLRLHFSQVVVLPGETAIFVASNAAAALTSSAEELVARLRARRLQTAYVREYYLPFRMAPDRVADLNQEIATVPGTRINRDFVPVAYYFDVVLWSGQFSTFCRQAFAALAGVTLRRALEATVLLMLLAAALFRWGGASKDRRGSAAFCVTTMGFTVLALEVLLLLGFQAIYGYVYHQLAVIIAAFMAGMALGSWLAMRRLRGAHGGYPMRWLIVLQLCGALSPLLLYVMLTGLGSVRSAIAWGLISHAVFPLAALLAGGLGGIQFPVANQIYFEDDSRANSSPGALYAMDLAGACLGALVISAYLVPVFGFFNTALLIAVVNLLPAALAMATNPPSVADAR